MAVYHGDFRHASSPARIWATTLDVVIVLSAVSAIAIALGGGGTFQLATLRVSATSPLRPLLVALLLSAYRLCFGWRIFLATPALHLDSVAAAALEWCRRRHYDLTHISSRRAALMVVVIAASSLAAKLLNAYLHFGFWTGDDVEIQEMSLSMLNRTPWHAWDLRCAFYPLGFVYPVHFFLKWAGVSEIQTFVFGSRAAVALWSTFVVWLTFRTASRVCKSQAIGVLSALILASSKLHIMSGSYELPRAVSTAFVLVAFFWLNDDRRHRAAPTVAGAALGIAAAMRFSEEVFLVRSLSARKRTPTRHSPDDGGLYSGCANGNRHIRLGILGGTIL